MLTVNCQCQCDKGYLSFIFIFDYSWISRNKINGFVFHISLITEYFVCPELSIVGGTEGRPPEPIS